MKPDIQNRADIELLVYRFYDKVKTDVLIAPFFTDVIEVNWDKHLPKMVDFWEGMLFHTGAYLGNPLTVHQHIHSLTEIKAVHFQRWLELFTETADELFEGLHTGLIKQRASSMVTVMKIKLKS